MLKRKITAVLLCVALTAGGGIGSFAQEGGGGSAGSGVSAPISQAVKALGENIDGENAFDYLSFVFMGWRTTGGTWQNRIIEDFVHRQLLSAGYKDAGTTDASGSADGDYAWTMYDTSVSSNVWAPEYAKLEVVQAPAGSEALVGKINVETASFNPTTETYIDYYDNLYGVKSIDDMWAWITKKDENGNRINVLNGEEAKLGKRTHLAWQTCFTDPAGTKPQDAQGLTGRAFYVGTISGSSPNQRSSRYPTAADEAQLAGGVLVSDSSLSSTFTYAQKVGAVAVMSANSLNDYNTPVIDGEMQFMDSARYASGTGTNRALAAMTAGKPIVEWQLSRNQKAALIELINGAETPVLVKSVSVGRIYPMNDAAQGGKGQAVGIAEIKGASKPDERILICAHVQEPGCNDNATGVAAMLEMAVRVKKMIDEGKIARPERTITFLWGDEMNMGTVWNKFHGTEIKKLKLALDMDMVGEDPSKTGGVMRIEKTPDPSVANGYTLDRLPGQAPYYDSTYKNASGSFVRLPDSDTLWGSSGAVSQNYFRTGHFLNDLYMAVTQEVIDSVDDGFRVEVCPYEGGSDHSTFLGYKIPALLTWHFTDYTYHSSVDTLAMASAREMRNVDIVTFATAYTAANVTDEKPDNGASLMDVVYRAAEARFALERENTAHHRIYADANGKSLATELTNELRVLREWGAWYEQAVKSLSSYPLSYPNSTPANTPNVALLNAPSEEYLLLEEEYAARVRALTDEAVENAYAAFATGTPGFSIKPDKATRTVAVTGSGYAPNQVFKLYGGYGAAPSAAEYDVFATPSADASGNLSFTFASPADWVAGDYYHVSLSGALASERILMSQARIVSPVRLYLRLGEAYQLQFNVDGEYYTLDSSNKGVVTITSDGVITPRRLGNAVIGLKSTDGSGLVSAITVTVS
ncbi:MAG: M28 family peptidase [Clostridiales Family XIII bacterium]|jgi:hypothetical protein|nr:M28 family peptidase [Clostridiales Family XIII bacterium]